ncbi:hypothetical protein BN132_279 [Cronobacter turicensis 564]|nr:hypothetical protein BN132_279 [Cronobacter turicensis 564]
MRIHHYLPRVKIVDVAKQRQRRAPLRFGLRVAEIAQMLAQHRLAAARKAKGIFKIRAEAERGGQFGNAWRKRDGIRHKAARPAQHLAAGSHHRIIHPLQDVAVMQHKAVGNLPKLRERLGVGKRGRLAAAVAGSHHQRTPDALHQEVLQRVRGQHHAGFVKPWRDGLAQRRQVRVIHQHNRGGGRGQLRAGVIRQRCGVRQHHRQRFCRAMFAGSQARHGVSVLRIAGEMKPADAFDGDDQACVKRGDGGLKRRLFVCRALAAHPAQLRAARRAGHGLRVKAPVGRIAVLRVARRAERKARHRGVGPVVGHGVDNGEARAAVGAVDKRVAPAGVCGIVEFAQALRAGGGVRGDLRAHRPAAAFPYRKLLRPSRPAKRRGADAVDTREWRAVLPERGDKRAFAAGQAHFHPCAVITDVAGER